LIDTQTNAPQSINGASPTLRVVQMHPTQLVNRGYYLHPGFKGSWSIKNVLPVMKPELSYQELAINKGDQASITWWNICFGNLEQQEKLRLSEALRRYCELDTLAMVELFKVFRDFIK